MRRTLLGTISALAIAAGVTLVTAGPVQAAPVLRFHSTQYDSPVRTPGRTCR